MPFQIRPTGPDDGWAFGGHERYVTDLRREYDALWATGGLFGVVLKREEEPILQFATAILDPKFSREYLAGGDWGGPLAVRYLESGRRAILPDLDDNPRPAALAAADGGLHVHLFRCHWVPGLDPEDELRARGMAAPAFLRLLQGARLQLLTVEVSQEWRPLALEAGLQVIRDGGKEETAIFGVDRSSVLRAGNVSLETAFAAPPPNLALGHLARRVLYHFRLGRDDAEIAARTGRSPRSMKTTWSRIFELVEPALGPYGDRWVALRAFLEIHPEECWPYGTGRT